MKDWKDDIRSTTALGGMKGNYNASDSHWTIEQDLRPYLEQARLDREAQEAFGKSKGFRKMATIPDIIAIEILTNHKLDLHDPDFGKDPQNSKKLREILMREYPELLVNT